jgi:hypothetical protein
LVFLSQGCLPPPPYHHDRNRQHRHRHGYSLDQLPKSVAQLIIQDGGDFSDQGKVAHQSNT